MNSPEAMVSLYKKEVRLYLKGWREMRHLMNERPTVPENTDGVSKWLDKVEMQCNDLKSSLVGLRAMEELLALGLTKITDIWYSAESELGM